MAFVTTSVLAWICLGAAVGAAGMMASRSGSLAGVAFNVPLGALGALGGGVLGYAVHAYARLTAWSSLAAAALGAAACVVAYWAATRWWTERRGHRANRLPPRPA
jgi:uncharacterized membrane protein YeaQ/YmgE (transglycosylase-associated protein family)